MSYRRLYHSDYAGIITVFLIAVLFFPTSGALVGGDSENYVLRALDILNGQGVTYLKRGPLFLYSIAASFSLFGHSIESAYLVVRLFFMLNIILSFLIGREMKNAWLGIACAFFTVSSFGLHNISLYVLADTIVPFFILLYIWLIQKAVKSSSSIWYILSGIVLGFEFLTKEYYFFLFCWIPLLVPIFSKSHRQKTFVFNLIGFYLACLITISPWLYYVYSNGGSLSVLLGKAASENKIALGLSFDKIILTANSLFELFSNIELSEALSTFYQKQLCRYFSLGPLLLVSVVYLSWKNRKKPEICEIIIIMLVLFLIPVVIAAGQKSYRIGGMSILFYLLYISLGTSVYYFSQTLFRCFSPYTNKVRCLGRIKPLYIFFVIVLSLLAYQWFNPRIPTHHVVFKGVKKGKVYLNNTFWRNDSFTVIGHFNNDMKEAAQWLLDNSPRGNKVALSFGPWTMNFYTNYGYEFTGVGKEWSHKEILDSIQKGTWEKKRAIFIYPEKHRSLAKKGHRSIQFLFEEDIIEELSKKTDEYYVISKRGAMVFTFYLEQSPWAQSVFENKSVKIYKIDKPSIKHNKDFPLLVSDYYDAYVTAWQEKFPGEVNDFKEVLDTIGIGQMDLQAHSYKKYQMQWIREHLTGKDARVAFCNVSGKFALKEEYKAKHLYRNYDASWVKKNYDYFLMSNYLRQRNKFPKLLSGLSEEDALIVFPKFDVLGEGWEVFDMKQME